MRVVLQRVSEASVRVDGAVVGEIGRGLLLLAGFTEGDGEAEVKWMSEKVANLRVFPDEEGKMNLSLSDIAGGLLVVSQFTLYGDAEKGRRPSFVRAASPERAIPLYERFVAELESLAPGRVARGEFGAMMEVSLVNDGPVTLLLERESRGRGEGTGRKGADDGWS
jgi:D-tyrosyl-tRNA(Tyr) deacylase